jgi:hypothetical protein
LSVSEAVATEVLSRLERLEEPEAVGGLVDLLRG